MVGISLRSVFVDSHKETRDCLDSRLSSLFFQSGIFPILLPASTPFEMIDDLHLDGIVLSGGEDIGPNFQNPRDKLERHLIDWSIENAKPLVGICRGMQMLQLYFGGVLEQVDGHVASYHDLIFSEKSKFPTDALPRKVNSFHKNAIGNVSEHLEVLATSPDFFIESFLHKTHPLLGIMWHPERDNCGDFEFILKFFEDRWNHGLDCI